ncbi:MAG: hypothetical protein QXK88_07950 [Desulfurococcaceae archaeon]
MSHDRDLPKEDLKVINVGLRVFYEELKKQGVKVIHVSFEPKVRLEKELEEKLAKLL